jgi:hypothetical protein
MLSFLAADSRVLRFVDQAFRVGNPVFRITAASIVGFFVLLLLIGVIHAFIKRKRNTAIGRPFKGLVTVLTIGAEFARPLRKKQDHSIDVVVLKQMTCQSEDGETVQVELPITQWDAIQRGDKGLLVAKGREFISFK